MLTREKSLGEYCNLSFVDRFGIYLSNKRIMKVIKSLKGHPSCLDLGCGYHAKLLSTISPYIKEGIGVDISINKYLMKDNLKIKLIESEIDSVFEILGEKQFDLILLISVLEHLDNPLTILQKTHKHLKEKGTLLINVPTWRGKTFLELSAFRLRFSPALEIDDHKMYYDKKDLWPLVVKAGFKPSKIKLEYHKLGLNLFCTANK